MDVTNAYLNGYIVEEFYVEQPSGFESFDLPNHVYKLKNALYGLKQALRAWYMIDLAIFYLRMTLRWENFIILSLLRLKTMSCL